jgi:hypothetical protein
MVKWKIPLSQIVELLKANSGRSAEGHNTVPSIPMSESPLKFVQCCPFLNKINTIFFRRFEKVVENMMKQD